MTNSTVPDLELTSNDIIVSYITGIDDIVVGNFEMYPNPSTGNSINISINDPEAVEEIMIINGSGQLVKTEKISDQNIVININDLTKGMYFVKVTYKDGQYQMEKLIVK